MCATGTADDDKCASHTNMHALKPLSYCVNCLIDVVVYDLLVACLVW